MCRLIEYGDIFAYAANHFTGFDELIGMKFSQSDSDSRHRIRLYDASSITIQGTTYTQSVMVTARAILSPWPVYTLADLSPETLQPALDLSADIWIMGTGQQHEFPSRAMRQLALQHNIGLEVMSTPAACRTFNVLLAESRNVVGLLMLGNLVVRG